jgi:hypothetical protein
VHNLVSSLLLDGVADWTGWQQLMVLLQDALLGMGRACLMLNGVCPRSVTQCVASARPFVLVGVACTALL